MHFPEYRYFTFLIESEAFNPLLGEFYLSFSFAAYTYEQQGILPLQ